MNDLWIGVVEVLTEPSTGEGNTRAFTNVVTWSNSTSHYESRVQEVFSEYGWTVIGFENGRPVDSDRDYDEDVAEIIVNARTNLNACMFATMHYYPSRPA